MATGKKHKVVWGVPSFWIERIPEIYAVERGLFDKRNISLEIRYYYGGPELCQAVNSGEVHIGNLGLPPFLKGYMDGLPAKIIGSSILQQLDHYLVARPGINSIAELKGKKVGILSPGSCDSYFIRRMVATEGLDGDKDIELKSMGQALSGDLCCFTNGDIDAGFVVEPKVSLGESNNLFHIIGRVGDYYPRYQWGIIFASDHYLNNNSSLLRSIMEAYRESCRLIFTDPVNSLAIGAKHFNVDLNIFQKALLRNLDNWVLDSSIDFSGLQNGVQVQKDMGVGLSGLDIDDLVQLV